MAQTHYIVGPPGTGKTDWVQRAVSRVNERYGRDSALVVSLTRAAAAEAAGRVELDRRSVGTLHSHCFHALGRPQVVTGPLLRQWNEEYPDWRLTGSGERGEVEEIRSEAEDDGAGDALLRMVEKARHTAKPVPFAASRFAEAWTDFKKQCDAVDFTDMITRAISDIPLPPGQPQALLVDEAQDLSELEIGLLDRWSQHVDQYALVGDPNQSIYHWRFSSDRMAHIVPTVVLGKSWRVPRTVRDLAQSIIKRSSTYLDAPYEPRDGDEGAVHQQPFAYLEAERIVELISELEGTVMVLASCGYMLNPLVAVMREHAIPYHNPYRATDAAWNPLAQGSERRRTAVDRLEAFLSVGLFLVGDGPAPLPWQTALLVKTVKRAVLGEDPEAALEALPEQATAADMLRMLRKVFRDESLAAITKLDCHWLIASAYADKKRSLAFPVEVFEQRGVDELLSPRIMVGTIHSVKGGQADHVVLAPDISIRGEEAMRTPGWAGKDGVLRTFYVGATRARKSLHVLTPHRWAAPVMHGRDE